MMHSPTITEIAKALHAFQGQVPSIVKDAVNPHYHSKFATLDTVWETIRPLLKENGLALAQFPEGESEFTSLLTHTSGEWFLSTLQLYPRERSEQGRGASISYVRRYTICAMLGLTMDDDDDGEAASKHQAGRPIPQMRPKDALTPIRNWIVSLPGAARERAVQAVFGCAMKDLPGQPPAAIRDGMVFIDVANQARVKWDAPDLKAALDRLRDSTPDIAETLPQPPAPKAVRQPKMDAYSAGLRREILELMSQVPADKLPLECMQAIDDLSTGAMVLEEWRENLQGMVQK